MAADGWLMDSFGHRLTELALSDKPIYSPFVLAQQIVFYLPTTAQVP